MTVLIRSFEIIHKVLNDASQAVCSDGVTVVKTKPSVKNVILKDAKTAPRLVADANNTLWIISNDLMRTVINDTDDQNKQLGMHR
jgi:hypothetical protein